MNKNVNIQDELEVKNSNPIAKFFKNLVKPSLDKRKARAGYAFVLPFIIGVILIYVPILADSFWFSFNKIIPNDSLSLTLQFVGFEHYVTIFQNPTFVTTLLSALQQLVFEVPAIIVFSLFIAVVLNQKMLGRAAFRAIFFVPVIISTGIMATINNADKMVDNAGSGIDDGSGSGGASELVSVLDIQALFANMKVGGELVSYVVGIVNNVYTIINYSGVQMLIFLAGLQSISPSIYEACQIEGATGWETFWKITFPMISPMILVNAVYSIIDSFTRADNPIMSYIENFPGSAETGSAIGWVYFLIVMLIIAVVAAIASSFVFYQRRD